MLRVKQEATGANMTQQGIKPETFQTIPQLKHLGLEYLACAKVPPLYESFNLK